MYLTRLKSNDLTSTGLVERHHIWPSVLYGCLIYSWEEMHEPDDVSGRSWRDGSEGERVFGASFTS